MSVAYTHVWRASDADRPCNLTGNEGADPNGNGQIWIEITNQDGTTSVPKEQLVLFDIWRAEQTKAAKIIGNGAGTAPDALQPNPTASVAFLRAIIPAGPWVLTSIVPDGVTRTKALEATDEVNAIEFIMSENAAGKGLYYTSADCGRPISKPAKGDLYGARLLHVDSDPNEGEPVEDAKARALAAYRVLRPPAVLHRRLRQRTAPGLAAQQEVPVPSGPAGPEQSGA